MVKKESCRREEILEGEMEGRGAYMLFGDRPRTSD